jgi:hypothetical protein
MGGRSEEEGVEIGEVTKHRPLGDSGSGGHFAGARERAASLFLDDREHRLHHGVAVALGA